jgi:TRAP-type C4-dicarboxylate transport system permease small subunit
MYTLYTYIIFIVVMEVVRRFVLSIPSRWGEETARLMYVYLTWIGASWGIKKRAHIRIDFLFSFVSERVKALLYILSDVLFIVFSVLMIRWSIPQVQTLLEFGARTQAGTASRIFFFVAIPLGAALMIVRALQMLYLDVNALRNGESVYEGESIFGGDA